MKIFQYKISALWIYRRRHIKSYRRTSLIIKRGDPYQIIFSGKQNTGNKIHSFSGYRYKVASPKNLIPKKTRVACSCGIRLFPCSGIIPTDIRFGRKNRQYLMARGCSPTSCYSYYITAGIFWNLK